MTKYTAMLGLAALSSIAFAHAQTGGVVGDWKDPSGSIVRVAPCGDTLCATLVALSAAAPVKVDSNNPDESLRTRPLCGLQIGEGFRSTDPTHAEDGKLYDPRNGKTYKGEMTSEGSAMQLRGYVGIKAFGRNARWERMTEPVQACHAEPDPAGTAPKGPAPAVKDPAPAKRPASE